MAEENDFKNELFTYVHELERLIFLQPRIQEGEKKITFDVGSVKIQLINACDNCEISLGFLYSYIIALMILDYIKLDNILNIQSIKIWISYDGEFIDIVLYNYDFTIDEIDIDTRLFYEIHISTADNFSYGQKLIENDFDKFVKKSWAKLKIEIFDRRTFDSIIGTDKLIEKSREVFGDLSNVSRWDRIDSRREINADIELANLV